MRGFETEEREKEVYQLAKVREIRSKDYQHVFCIKSEDKIVMGMNKCWE